MAIALEQIGEQISREVNDYLFRKIHSSSLIYNACWEDPRIDRQLMALDSQSKVVMLTSAGCNVLDYLLDSPAQIHAVDVNPHQNALLELKLATIQQASHNALFALFGQGKHTDAPAIIESLSPHLSQATYEFWQRKAYYFEPPKNRGSFYYCGSSGKVAWFFRNYYLRVRRSLRDGITHLLDSTTLAEQQQHYASVEAAMWDRATSWLTKQPVVMAMLGVPRAQMQLMHRGPEQSIQGYVTESMRRVFTQIPMQDNYFWRVYLTGQYTQACCPNYLKPENFALLRRNAGRVFPHTMSMADFLRRHPGRYSHFVLLDHQDWMAAHAPEALKQEWRLILQNSRPGAKILMRSASPELDFLPPVAREALQFYPELSEPLHQTDRVGTYASLHFAEVKS
ncbi:MAG: BtaA family protein [Caldilineaceae bacterium]